MEKSQPENAVPIEAQRNNVAQTQPRKEIAHEGLSRREIELRKKIAQRFGRQTDHLDLNNIIQEEE